MVGVGGGYSENFISNSRFNRWNPRLAAKSIYLPFFSTSAAAIPQADGQDNSRPGVQSETSEVDVPTSQTSTPSPPPAASGNENTPAVQVFGTAAASTF